MYYNDELWYKSIYCNEVEIAQNCGGNNYAKTGVSDYGSRNGKSIWWLKAD